MIKFSQKVTPIPGGHAEGCNSKSLKQTKNCLGLAPARPHALLYTLPEPIGYQGRWRLSEATTAWVESAPLRQNTHHHLAAQ